MVTAQTATFRTPDICRGLILLAALLPLFYFPSLTNLYRLPKETLAAFMASVVAGLYLLNRIRSDKHEPVRLPFAAPLILYLLWSGLSLMNAINLFEGLRHFLNVAVGITLFWATANSLGTNSIRSFLTWATVAGTAVSLVGIIQAWGVEIPTLPQVAPPSATFGNKNIAAQYLLFILPVAFYLLLTTSKPVEEYSTAFFAATLSTYLVYTWTRAAWGGVVTASLILWICLRAGGHSPREILTLNSRKWGFFCGIALVVLGANLFPPFFLQNWQPGWKGTASYSASEHLGAFFELEHSSSAQTRFAIWANSLAIFADHPFLGVGKGNFQFIYPLYNRRVVRDPSFTVEAKAAEAHNDYVQLLAEVGLLGTGAFLWFLVCLARDCWQSLKTRINPLIISVAFALAALLAEAFWDFPFAQPVSTAFFWIYAAILWRLTNGERSQNTKPAKSAAALVIGALLTLCALTASILNFTHLRAEFYYSRAVSGNYEIKDLTEKLRRAEEDFKRAVHLYPFDFRYHHWLAVLLLRTGHPEEALQANLRALALNPYHINTLNNLGVIYTALGNMPKAVQAFETTLRIWPDYVNVHNNLGQIYEKTGAKEKAIKSFQSALQINPNNQLAQKNLAALLKDETQP